MKSYTATLIMFLVLSGTAKAESEEHIQCPDFPAYKSILDEGVNRLQQLRPESTYYSQSPRNLIMYGEYAGAANLDPSARIRALRAALDKLTPTGLVENAIQNKDWDTVVSIIIQLPKQPRLPFPLKIDDLRNQAVKALSQVGRRSDVWRIIDDLSAQGCGYVLKPSMPEIIAISTDQERSKIVELTKATGASEDAAQALEQKGWSAEAEGMYIELSSGVKKTPMSQALLARFYRRHDRPDKAKDIYSRYLSDVDIMSSGDQSMLKNCISSMDMISNDIKSGTNAGAYDDVMKRIKELRSTCVHRIERLQCLELSQKLSNTGWALESRQDFKSAKKMYSSALEIKEKNLGETDVAIIPVLIDLARVTGKQGKTHDAKQLYLRALQICRTNPSADYDIHMRTLESYAQFLSEIHESKHAESIYAIARSLSKPRNMLVNPQPLNP